MTPPAITVDLGDSLARAAYLMQRHKVWHLPVVDADDRLLGIVSRGDLLRIFLRPDAEIREDIRSDVLGDTLELAENAFKVSVDGGVATLAGNLELASTAAAAIRLAATVPGVVHAVDRLTWSNDDLSATGHRTAKG